MRGIMTCLAVRMTPGSVDNRLPRKDDLFKSFNAIFKVKQFINKRDKNDLDNTKYITKITVGARALSKHADRTKDV